MATEIDRACREIGFFGITGHGVDPMLQDQLERSSREFFALDDEVKAAIAMARAGRAWRGWFPVGGELTSGRPDQQGGPLLRCRARCRPPTGASPASPLHGANLFPAEPAELGPIVLRWLDEMRRVAEAVMRGIALGLGLPAHWFADNLTTDPTVLFRIFHYPPTTGDARPMGRRRTHRLRPAHGARPGLARRPAGRTAATARGSTSPPEPGVLRLQPRRHARPPDARVGTAARRTAFATDAGAQPALVPVLLRSVLGRRPCRCSRSTRTDHRRTIDGPAGTAPTCAAWNGRYGDYLTAKVARVFPDLFAVTST